MLCLGLFAYKFAPICCGIILILNLILIIEIKKIYVQLMGPTWSMWIRLGWVRFLLIHHGELGWKNSNSTQPDPCTPLYMITT